MRRRVRRVCCLTMHQDLNGRVALVTGASRGLGREIVKHLAESMGASVTVTSEPGKGSRFETRLPPAV